LSDIGRCSFHITKDSSNAVVMRKYLCNNKPEKEGVPANLKPIAIY
jgi:hypothetical protein